MALSTPQRILLIILYALIVLMIIFSLGATRNIGQGGYDKCVQQKCDDFGEATCNKARELNNCCLGAGGRLGVSGSETVCVFG